MKPCEQTRSDLLSTLERALCLLESPFSMAYSAADQTWLEAARTDLLASVELMRREPGQTHACMSAAELTAKAGICLASVPAAHSDPSICEAARLIVAWELRRNARAAFTSSSVEMPITAKPADGSSHASLSNDAISARQGPHQLA